VPRGRLLTTRGQAFLLLGAVTTLGGVLLGYPDITRIGAVLLLLPLLAMLWASRRPPSIRVSRTVAPPLLTPDEVGRVEVEFVNVGSSRTAMFLAEEQFDYALGDRPRFILPRMDRGEHRRLRYQIRSRHRGAYQLGPVTLRMRDPFGLTYVALNLVRMTEVLVLPRVYDLGSRVTRGQGRGTEGELPQMVALHGEDDVSIRNYRDGDELRRVHWPATAHRGELMVRQEDRPTRRRAILLLDGRLSAHPGDGYHPSFEWAVSALASVARHLVHDGFVVHLLTDGTVADGTAEHQIDLDAAMTVLAKVQPVKGTSLDALAAAAHTFTAGGVLVVAAVVAHDEQELRDLAVIRQPGSTAMAFVLDREAFGRAETDVEADPHRRSARLRQVFDDAGWRSTLVGPQHSVAGAWEELRQTQRLGERV
jgi:uncharacterized protein (DUF58 family)